MRALSGSLVGLLIFVVSEGHAGEAVIDLFRSSFLPETISIELGDSVRWQRISGDHRLRSGKPEGEIGTPDEPGALFDTVLDEANPTFEFRFDSFREGGYFFFDEANPTQIGHVSISSGAIELRVAVVDNVFNPEFAYIFEGDSIRWEHEPMENLHTVTSGLSSLPEDDPGVLFDEESSDANPVFVYEFASSGEYPYFCRPHEQLGMTGVVYVQKRFLRADSTLNSVLDISDPIFTLGVLFLGDEETSCLDSMDSNDDGKVDISDATFTLNFLFTGGASIPKPYPFPGGDRTDDALLCY